VAYVEDILAAIPDRGRAARFGTRPDYSELKIRLTIMAWTGIPPIQLERLRPRDVDFVQGRMYLQPRRKGKGSPGAWVALLPDAIDAFREYARVGLWGRSFSRSSMAKSWKGAIKRVTADLEREAAKTNDRTVVDTFRDAIPPRCRPYDLRHTFATEAYRVTGDLRAVAELLQHANLETTKRYTGGAVSERVTSAIAKMAHASQGPRTTPAAPRLNKEPQLRSVK
jgi:integrase